jgi:HEAT repeat protein
MAEGCVFLYMALQRGKKGVERLLLNVEHEIDKAGEYSVDAVRTLPHVNADLDYFKATKETLEVRATLYFRIEQNAPTDPNAFQSWADQLRSTDPIKRREAARVLASVAPQSLEDTLLTFAENADIRSFAPLALHRLNTERSMAAMAELLRRAEPGTYEHMKSADYLAESGDQQWFPLLLEVAQKNARIGSYDDDAAELGGDRMLPALVALANSPDKEFTRINAVTAMGSTGSRTAIPILLDFLRSPDTDVADRARYALRVLTHRTASDDQNENPQSQYPKWSQWWAHEGVTARIYKATECGDFIPILLR